MFGLYNKNKLFKIGKVALEFCQRRTDGDLAFSYPEPFLGALENRNRKQRNLVPVKQQMLRYCLLIADYFHLYM